MVEEHVERKEEQEVSRGKCYMSVNWRDLPRGFVKTLTTLRVSKQNIPLLGIRIQLFKRDSAQEHPANILISALRVYTRTLS
jgi:hypothetical protein